MQMNLKALRSHFKQTWTFIYVKHLCAADDANYAKIAFPLLSQEPTQKDSRWLTPSRMGSQSSVFNGSQ
jgi:hypothetical protein